MDKKPVATFLKFTVAFLIIISISLGAYFAWTKVFSPEAKETKRQRENLEKYEAWMSNYERAMREDTYGGKTPQETLDLLIAALEKEDIELIYKYFVLEDSGERDPELLETLKQRKLEGKLKEIATDLKKMQLEPECGMENYIYCFALVEDGVIQHTVRFIENKFAKIWKIESL